MAGKMASFLAKNTKLTLDYVSFTCLIYVVNVSRDIKQEVLIVHLS